MVPRSKCNICDGTGVIRYEADDDFGYPNRLVEHECLACHAEHCGTPGGHAALLGTQTPAQVRTKRWTEKEQTISHLLSVQD